MFAVRPVAEAKPITPMTTTYKRMLKEQSVGHKPSITFPDPKTQAHPPYSCRGIKLRLLNSYIFVTFFYKAEFTVRG